MTANAWQKLRSWLTALIVPLALGVAWELAVRAGLAPGRLMPPPSRLLQTAIALTR
jgi:sulfonate transport system permease protein